jgi:hypothetical protein
MPKVYVVNNKSFDLAPAKMYGDVEVLYEGTPNDIFMTSKHVHIIKQKLLAMESSDYLLLVGNLVVNALAFAITMERFGFVNILLYNIKDNRYEPRVIHRHQLKGGENAERN